MTATAFDFEAHDNHLKHIVRQFQREAVREAYAARDQQANRNLWSMPSGEPFQRRTAATIVQAAHDEEMRFKAFHASPRGRFVAATSGLLGYQGAASARSAYDRSFAGETVDVPAVGHAINCLLTITDPDARPSALLAIAALADLLKEA